MAAIKAVYALKDIYSLILVASGRIGNIGLPTLNLQI